MTLHVKCSVLHGESLQTYVQEFETAPFPKIRDSTTFIRKLEVAKILIFVCNTRPRRLPLYPCRKPWYLIHGGMTEMSACATFADGLLVTHYA
mmetsp:Transcript_73699/g.117495  ORF Transcript_73699/g.117495 Transcript_73699/m.117495 type:complete len:93 (+) Transcript_73699:139-417(+)